MSRIKDKFSELKRKKQKAFIVFITAGYPDLAATGELVVELERRGADIIELGVPFSDPMADGPVIQEASEASLRKKTNLGKILNLVKSLRRKVNIPICLMSYYNPIFCFGEEKFLRKAKSCGVDGLIIPDLPPEEAGGLFKPAAKYGIDIVCFIAPTTQKERMKYIARVSGGFIYYVSLTGTTGARKRLSSDLVANLKKIKSLTPKPVCVGFGISTPEQVRQAARISDGVIVGSAVVKKIKENINHPDLARRVGNFIAYLKG